MPRNTVVVVGGGAAGMLAAGRAAEAGAQVILLEKNKALGRKINISGKGRCNVTNAGEIRDFIENYPGGGQFLYSALSKLSNRDLMKLLEQYGVELKTERGGRVFPVSDTAGDIVGALEKYMNKYGVEVRKEEEVLGLLIEDQEVRGVKTAKGEVIASRVIVTTGGKSYPGTGSTGDGYKWAEEAGHMVVPLKPALVPLNIREEWVKGLQGLTLKNVEAAVLDGERVLQSEFGEMLFAHFGVTGPIILTLSRAVVNANKAPGRLQLRLNLKSALDEETLDKRLQRDFQKNQKKQLKNALDELLPKRLTACVITLSGIDPEKFVHQITREDRRELLHVLTGMTMTIEGPRSLTEAIVTVGGVSLKEINPRTMESKLVRGLYFAGEVLDIDGYTGGYNLQAAFSTGFVAGESAAKD
ncbi:MAG: NAD(P)/FAD-dependent oxidoreductase [Clostridia bacterium]|nr:NAD(P)/FAD-dependent oxidoreductase [Clostridia bacterium]